uniref:Reverse transcriptase Ty1/copia-type domain-containing protein n=1 Tax=Tanacetum cinerariifolium TaxID=118510 RepID=A0A6L2L617_TANCI|nr:hypothetical protein [Tanacetum cinerariifolium]
MVHALKLQVLKTREYDLWSMRIEQYLTFTYHALWEVIVNRDSVASASAEGPIPLKTAEQKLARKNELKAKITLMLAIPNEHLLKFHACKDAKLWEAIKNSFGGNKESKKIQKTFLKQNHKNFAASNNTSNTNKTVNTTHSVSTASSKNQASTASYANDVMFSFFFNQFNAPQLDNEDLEHINTNDLEEIDLNWQVAMLTMRVKKFIKKTGRKLDLNGKDSVGFDRKKVDSYNFHRRGHFSRECRAPRNQGNRNQDAPTRNAPMDTFTTNALVVQDGIGGYDWSFQAKEELTNFALMAYISQGYQTGLESLEARIVVHEKNEAVYKDDIAFLKYNVQVKDISIKDLKNHDGDDNQVNDMFKKDEGYHVVPPHYIGNYMSPRVDLSFVGLDNFVFKSKVSETTTSVPKIESNASKTSKDSLEKPKTVRSSAPIIEDWESNSEDENVFKSKEVKKTIKPSLEKIEFANARNTTVENENKAEKPRNSVRVLGGKITGPKEIRPVWDNTSRVNHQNKLTHPHPKRNFVPAVVLTNFEQVPVNAGKQSSHRATTSVSNDRHVNTTASRPNVNSALPTTYSYFKAHSPVRRPFNQKSAVKTNNFNEKVNTAKVNNVTTVGPKAVVSAAERNRNNAVNVLFTDTACVVLSPNFKLFDECQVLLKVLRNNNMYSFDLKNIVPIGGIENQMDHKVKIIRRNNGTEFKNRIMNEFYEMKGTKANINVGQVRMKTVPGPQYVLLPLLTYDSQGLKNSETEVADDARKKSTKVPRKENGVQDPAKEGEKNDQEKDLRDQEEALRKQLEQESKRLFAQGEAANTNSTNKLNIVSSPVNVVGSSFTTIDPRRERAQRNEFESMFGQDKDANGNRIAATLPNANLPTDLLMPNLEDTANLQDTRIFSGAYDDEVEGAEANFNNLELTTVVNPIPTTRIHKDHPKEKIIGDPLLALQTRRMTKTSQEHAMRFVDLPKGKHAIGTKWVLRNKKDERGIVVRNKARLVAQGYTQEEGIDYDEVFASVARIEAIKLFFAYASFMRFIVYQMDVKSAFLYGIIEDEVYLCQPPSFENQHFPNKKPIEYEGFEQIIDFLNASYVKYALTVNPTVYTLYIEQFWASAKVKNVNKEAQIQSLVDKKKIIITEALIRRDLRFKDEGGVDCLSNKVIFKQLTLIGSTIASTIICLATNQKFNFSKYIFNNMVKHLDGGVKFLMYPIFVQVFLDNQVEEEAKSRRKQRKEIEVPSPSSEIPIEEGVPTTSNDPLPSGEVLDLKEAKTAQAKEIAGLEKRVKKLELTGKSRTLGLKRLRKVGTTSRIESSIKASLGRMKEEDMFRVNDLDGDEVIVDVIAGENVEQSTKVAKKDVSTTDLVTTAEIKVAKPKAITTAATIVTITGTRPKTKGIVMKEPSERPTPTPKDSSQKPLQAKDKGKGKMVEPEKPLKRKDQIMIDEEFAKNLKAQLQAELEEEERLAIL